MGSITSEQESVLHEEIHLVSNTRALQPTVVPVVKVNSSRRATPGSRLA